MRNLVIPSTSTLALSLILSACGTTVPQAAGGPEVTSQQNTTTLEAQRLRRPLPPKPTPTPSVPNQWDIDPNSSFLLPDDGSLGAVTCQADNASTKIRTYRVNGSRVVGERSPTLGRLSTDTYRHQGNVKLSAATDATFNGGGIPSGLAFTKDAAGQDVALLGWRGVLDGFVTTNPNDDYNTFAARAETVATGQKGGDIFGAEKYYREGTPTYNLLTAAAYGPDQATLINGSNSFAPTFYLLLEKSKGYAAGKGYLVSTRSTGYISPNDIASGAKTLPLNQAFGTFDCRVLSYR